MIDVATAPWAALILRVALGVLFLAHGLLKLLVFKPAGAYGYFQSLGLPGSVAYLTTAAELLGGAALIVGFVPRYVALLLIPLILGTIVMVHGKNGWMFSTRMAAGNTLRSGRSRFSCSSCSAMARGRCGLRHSGSDCYGTSLLIAARRRRVQHSASSGAAMSSPSDAASPCGDIR